MKPILNITVTDTNLSPDWIDALAFRAANIGKWDTRVAADFWSRLANLSFYAALFDALRRRDGGPDWLPGPTSGQFCAADHIARRLLASGFDRADVAGKPTFAPSLSQAVWRAAWDDLPPSFAAPAPSIARDRGRWFASVATLTAKRLVAEHPAWETNAGNLFRQLSPEDQFLSLCLTQWQAPAGPAKPRGFSVVDFIHHLYRETPYAARCYGLTVLDTPDFGDGNRTRWVFSRWLQEGWSRGWRLTDKSVSEVLPDLLREQTAENIAYTRRLLAKLLDAAGGQPIDLTILGHACIAYLKDRCGLVRDGHGPAVCVHAFDYGLWMAFGIRGLLPGHSAHACFKDSVNSDHRQPELGNN